MRALKINSYAQLIEEIDVNSLKDMQQVVGGLIEVAFYYPDDGETMK